jgi:phosphoheptose isomerase
VDVYPSIASFFQRHLEASSLAVDAIADTLGDAIDLLAHAILADRKLFSVGVGPDRASATALSSLLQHGVLRERPSLPVVELATHQVESSA